MKRSYFLLPLVLTISLLAGSARAQQQPTTDKEKFSYAVGFSVAQGLKNDGLDVEIETFLMAIRDVLNGIPAKMTEGEMSACFEAEQEKQQMARDKSGEASMKEGQAFLDSNRTKPGVIVHESGLQYKVLKEGTGAKPTAENEVTVHYRGKLINGKEFDSSYSRGEPITFRLAGLIKGWQVALPMMTQGSAWELYLPPDLAYGSRGAGGDIGPGATLIFEIELIAIK